MDYGNAFESLESSLFREVFWGKILFIKGVVAMATMFRKSMNIVRYNLVPRVHGLLGQRLFVCLVEIISGHLNSISAE